MATHVFHQPDEEKMKQALKRYHHEPVGVILHLAWQEGLTRKEIHDLTWNDVDFDAATLRLPEREVPLNEETAAVLEHWKKRCSGFSEYVAVTDRRKKRLVIQSMSALVRDALDAFGMAEVMLKDLRIDFIRRQLEQHPWTYVLRISGVSVETYRNVLLPLFAVRTQPAPAALTDGGGQEYRLWQIMQARKNTSAGIALWLLQQLGLELEQIVRLTWDDVDFVNDTLRLPNGSVQMTRGVRRVLEEEKARRAPDDDKHVILSPNARKPIDVARLSVVLRTELIRGGIENVSAVDIRRGAVRDMEGAQMLNFVENHGQITTKEAAALLGVSYGMARSRLKMLVEGGKLVCVGTKYYAAEKTVGPELHPELVLEFLSEHGGIRCQDAALLLNIPARQAGRLLRRMVDQGLIVREEGGRRYLLPGKFTID